MVFWRFVVFVIDIAVALCKERFNRSNRLTQTPNPNHPQNKKRGFGFAIPPRHSVLLVPDKPPALVGGSAPGVEACLGQARR